MVDKTFHLHKRIQELELYIKQLESISHEKDLLFHELVTLLKENSLKEKNLLDSLLRSL